MSSLYYASLRYLKRKHTPRRFKSHFGVTLEIAELIWSKVENGDIPLDYEFKAYHLLWVLYFLKVYPLQDCAEVFFNVDHKTYRFWVWRLIKCLLVVLDEVN